MEENTDKAYAINHIKHGVITALIIWGIDVGRVIVGFLSEGQFGEPEYADPWSWVAALVFVTLIWGMTRKSRTASVLILLVYLLGAGLQFMEAPSLLGVFMALIILFFLAKAVYGCFEYHKVAKAENPKHKPSKWWMFALGVPIVLVIGGFIVLYYLSVWGVIPAIHIKSYNEITDYEQEFLKEWSIIDGNETIDMFYSFGVLSYKEGGSLLTDKRIITYMEDEDGELLVTALPFEDIENITNDTPGDEWENAVFYAWPKNEELSGVYIILSTENNGDKVFMQKLNAFVSPPPKGPEMPKPTMGEF